MDTNYEVHPSIAQELQVTVPEQAQEPIQENTVAPEVEVAENQTVDTLSTVERQTQEPVDHSTKDRNLRALREARQQAEYERDQALRRIKELESKPQLSEIEIDDDSYAEGKHLKKLSQEIKSLKEQLHQSSNQSAVSIAETKLRAKFPDIDSVVTPENIEKLAEQYPDVAASLRASPDTYTMGSSAYTLIKQLGIVKNNLYDQNKEIIAKNAAKPRALASLSPQQGDSPLSKANAFANGLTDELKAQLVKEMNQFRKNI